MTVRRDLISEKLKAQIVGLVLTLRVTQEPVLDTIMDKLSWQRFCSEGPQVRGVLIRESHLFTLVLSHMTLSPMAT